MCRPNPHRRARASFQYQAMSSGEPSAGRRVSQARSVRALEQVRVVGLVRKRIDQRHAIPLMALHVEDERLDLVLRRLNSKTGAAGTVQLHLHLLKIDHGGLPEGLTKA